MSDKITFEGDDIDSFAGTIRQYKGPIEMPLALGEIVHLKVVAKVMKVEHVEHQRTGVLERDHVLKVFDIEVMNEDQAT